MKYLLPLVLSILLAATQNIFAKPSEEEIESKINTLLKHMSLEEKVGQMTLADWGVYQDKKSVKEIKQDIRKGKVGGFLNVNFNQFEANAYTELQRIAVEESPNKIPLLFGQDVIHGYKTIFPIPLGQAASWNPELVEQGARVAAEEATTDGIRWTFAPMIDIARDPRWGRIAESLGEDPYLASVLGAAMTKGFQSDDPSQPNTMAACAKHFVGYGAAEGGRDYNSAYIPENLLRNIYLEPFKASIDAGLMSIMSSYNSLNGIPATAHKQALKDILRDEWNFDGFVVSDWNSVYEMIPHGYARDEKHAAELAANAGIDFEMYSNTYNDYLKKLIKEEKYSEEKLNTSVANMLRIKLRLGLWENPYPRGNREATLLKDEFLDAARSAARETFVLLKNDKQVLPLKKSQRIAVIGPMADAAHDQMGTWVYDGEKKDTRTFLPAIKAYAGNDKVIFSPGLEFSRDQSEEGFAAALEAANQADVILYLGGEEAILTGEGHSRGDISLPGAQQQLISALAKTGKPLAVVIMAGRPLALRESLNEAESIMMAWHPGTMGGPALVDVLYGEHSPSGRLPVSWPVDAGQIPIYYNHAATGRPANDENYTRINDIAQEVFQHEPGNSSNHLDYGHLPQFPFGYGLTYSEFTYSGLKISKRKLKPGDKLSASIKIKNTGKVLASETVQLYVQDLVGSVIHPVKELKGFSRITLKPGASERVSFTLSTDDLMFFNQSMEKVLEPGKFKLWIGKNAHEGPSTDFVVK